jgi:hypothetical protein
VNHGGNTTLENRITERYFYSLNDSQWKDSVLSSTFLSKRFLMHNHLPALRFLLFLSGVFLLPVVSSAQAELQPWGNIQGIRHGDNLVKFDSKLTVENKTSGALSDTGKEQQLPKFERNGNVQKVSTEVSGVSFSVEVDDTQRNDVSISVKAKSKRSADSVRAWFSVLVPAKSMLLVNNGKPISGGVADSQLAKLLNEPVSELKIEHDGHSIVLKLPAKMKLRFRKENSGHLRVMIPLGLTKTNNETSTAFRVIVTAVNDPRVAKITVDPARAGRVFDGFGGNFRLQNAKTDPQVIDYCLSNMRVAWGRVEMPWHLWHPVREASPIDSARAGKIHPHVENSMRMAQRLSNMKIPVILSAWSAPEWAIIGKPLHGPGPDGVRGNPLNDRYTAELYKSIGDYIAYLKEKFGVDIVMFSFNESDLGINIRQTGEEHARLIKGLGQHFRSRGLPTQMLLGDNSDANTYEFIYPALNDKSTHEYIGAVSFHSWRGWDHPTLSKWYEAALRIDRPLIVGEGSIDAQAWGYPAIFEEPVYAMEEINLYVRLLNICQPASILQWQLTADYSPLSGGGIFGKEGPLKPTQRFFNLKQLAATPEAVKAYHATSDHEDIVVAAAGSENKFVLHLVNKGSARKTTIAGVPSHIRELKVFVTDKQKGMAEESVLVVRNGKAETTLPPQAFISLINP